MSAPVKIVRAVRWIGRRNPRGASPSCSSECSERAPSEFDRCRCIASVPRCLGCSALSSATAGRRGGHRWVSRDDAVGPLAALLLAGSGPGPAIAGGLALSLLVQAPGLWASRRRHGVLTAKGAEAAAHWKGVRGYLRADTEFTNAPPTSVAIWGPYLAYAAALEATDFDLSIAPPTARYRSGVAD